MPAIHLIIKGKVQGVFFRATAKDVADELNIKGWVKNTREGNVEITASGNKEHLDQFIQWCKKGPPKAVVTDVIITPVDQEEFSGFKIMRDQ